MRSGGTAPPRGRFTVYGFRKEALIDRIGIPAANVHPIEELCWLH